jgi:hypothetical protein
MCYGHGLQSKASDTPTQKSKQPQEHSSSVFMISMAYYIFATYSGGSFGGYFRFFGTTTYLGPSPPFGICLFRSELTIMRFDEKACGQVNTGKQKDSFEPVLTRD